MKNAEPDILGRAYEYLLRKFAEGQGQSAGEFYTPKEVGWLMAHLLDPKPYTTVYDPTCGSAGLLIKARLLFEQKNPMHKSKAPKLYGQEMNPVTFAMAKINMFLHDYTDSLFAIGDTLRNPGFSAEGAGVKKFDYVVANPMWNQDNYDEGFYESDRWKRFENGIPPASSADWGWLQHIMTSLNENGRAAVVLDTGAASRGSGSKSANKERLIRQKLVELDIIEGVVLLPENLFYNTPAAGIVILLNRNKPFTRSHQVLLVNASNYFTKKKPKNALTDGGIHAVVDVFESWESREKLSRLISIEELGVLDFNLSPSSLVDVSDGVTHRPLEAILLDLKQLRLERTRIESELEELISRLHLPSMDN